MLLIIIEILFSAFFMEVQTFYFQFTIFLMLLV